MTDLENKEFSGNVFHHDKDSALQIVDSCPKGVSPRMWEKFQKLKTKRQDVTRGSTNKRIKRLKQNVILKVQEEMRTDEELECLRANDVDLDEQPAAKKVKPGGTTRDSSDPQTTPGPSGSHSDSGQRPTGSENTASQWKDIQGYLGCNDHLRGVDRGKYAAKSKLEEQLDLAVKARDFSTAEKLSDQLAARQFGTKVTEAIDAKNYTERKLEDDEKTKQKRKKKLHWGFSEKQRWETKSNM